MRISQEDKFRFLDQADHIGKMRKLMGLRGKDCAKIFKVDNPTWSRMENGYFNNDKALSELQERYNEWCVDEILSLQDHIEYLKSLVK